jgi:hypothetical protein
VLDAFIIEELKRRERQEDRPQPEAPGPANDERDDRSPQKSGSDDEKPQRGVVIIDYSLG